MTTSQVTRPAKRNQRPVPPAGRRAEPVAWWRRPHRRPGPARLTARGVTAVVLLAVLCATAVVASVSVRDDIGRLRTSVAERADTANNLRVALSDLDAQRADSLAPGTVVVDADHSEIVGDQINALITAQDRRKQVSAQLRKLSSDTAHADVLEGMLDALGRYDDLNGRASYVDDQFPNRTPGNPPAITVAMNVQAGDLMKQTLLKAADNLSADYKAQAAHLRVKAHDAAVRWALVVGLLGALTLLYLLWWQRELARDYRRLLNPALAVGTAAVLAVTLMGSLALGAAAGSVTAADREGLSPLTRLTEAGTDASQAAAAESRWFVHGNFAAQDETQFDGLVKDLGVLLPPGGYDGLATEEERRTYRSVLTRFAHFRADDAHLRAQRAAGDINGAARTLTDVARGDVAFDFWDFSTTLQGLADQQLKDFQTHVDSARGDLYGWPAVPAAVLGAAAALVAVGLWRRYAEYR